MKRNRELHDHEAPTRRELAAGFDAVMADLDRAPAHELDALARAAERVEIGLSAYELGMEHLAQGARGTALHWLETASRYDVTSAERVLEDVLCDRDVDKDVDKDINIDRPSPAPAENEAAAIRDAALKKAEQLLAAVERKREVMLEEAHAECADIRRATVSANEKLQEVHRELDLLTRRREDINSEITRVQDVLEALESFEAPTGTGRSGAEASEASATGTRR
ncbi:hypothetical protein ABZ953_17330 [Streptomyces sp. NPDC046465]|uniref:hypothetical protein n=1 Tax=Streptomyces sp. NPDC046465 TaxID=3155810 RepID=UPI0033F93F06